MSVPKPTDILSQSEREALLAQMSGADTARAESLARVASLGVPDMGPDDMLQQALTDLVSMKRVWRRGVSVLVTLKVAMRSIASNSRKLAENARRDRYATVTTVEEEDRENGGRIVQTVEMLGPEDIVQHRQEVAEIEKLVKGDPDEESVLTAWYLGCFGTDAQKETGLTPHQYDAARKRIMRKARAARKMK